MTKFNSVGFIKFIHSRKIIDMFKSDKNANNNGRYEYVTK